ncbi:ribonuclease HII [Halobacteriales archaeon QS_1_68_20]|nr:MAG: ribonuclease HII [Halobacteriales archaeon QS_1_68_20]
MAPRVGVDEAGRGPVLGSMFAAAVRVPDTAVLPDGLDDSKELAPERREALAAELRDHPEVAVGVAEVAPARIDDPETDMNSLAVEAHATALDGIWDGDGDGGPDGDGADGGADARPEVVVDACDTSEARFARRVTDAVSRSVQVTAEHGADGNHDVVAAASVVAKVERDAHVAELAAEHGDVGSGYPSDPNTRAYLESYVDEHGEVPPFARSSWETCRQLLADSGQRGLGEF